MHSDALLAARRAVLERAPQAAPRVGIVLGSGLGAWAEGLVERTDIPYGDIPGMPVSTVPGHAGKLVLGRTAGGVPVACLSGRVHLYEGHAPERCVFGARLLSELGCHTVLLTNAAGGIASSLSEGALMLIVDHLNLTGQSPLVGPNDPRGPRFPDMTFAYDRAVQEHARLAAQTLSVPLAEGVYAGLLGPTYETPAEVRMLRAMGADAVGMSTVLEVIALRHFGVRIGGMSCITNMAAGTTDQPLSHAEVEETAKRVRTVFSALLTAWVERCGAQE